MLQKSMGAASNEPRQRRSFQSSTVNPSGSSNSYRNNSHNKNGGDGQQSILTSSFVVRGSVTTIALFCSIFFLSGKKSSLSSISSSPSSFWSNNNNLNLDALPVVTVFTSVSASSTSSSQQQLSNDNQWNAIKRQWNDLFHVLPDDTIRLEPIVVSSVVEQRAFIQTHCGQDVLNRYDEFLVWKRDASSTASNDFAAATEATTTADHLAGELWKYCALVHSLQISDPPDTSGTAPVAGAAYVDLSDPLLVRLQDLLTSANKTTSSTNGGRTAFSLSSLAILGDSYAPRTIHGSLLFLRPDHIEIPTSMMQLLVQTPIAALVSSVVLLPRTLYALIAKSIHDASASSSSKNGVVTLEPGSHRGWFLLHQTCRIDSHPRSSTGESDSSNRDEAKPPRTTATNSWTDINSLRLSHVCPSTADFCCSVYDGSIHHTVLLNRHPITPLPSTTGTIISSTSIQSTATASVSSIAVDPRMISSTSNVVVDEDSRNDGNLLFGDPYLRFPYNPHNLTTQFLREDLRYIATVEEEVFLQKQKRKRSKKQQSSASSPAHFVGGGLFDELLRNNCLPSIECNQCLDGDRDGADHDNGKGCAKCSQVCGCYCKTLCQGDNFRRSVSKRLKIHPPRYHKQHKDDPNRLIPRIVHQRWHEEITAEKYPDVSRLVQSFKTSGWEYRFYTEIEVVDFLTTHFPQEIVEAYNGLLPDDSKSDIFRYCVLLIYGGLYANVDTMLESNLDTAIEPNVGFLAPQDEELLPCLSQKFLAAAPGHPLLAKAIEISVNRVRNRYMQVDLDDWYCPRPALSMLRFDKMKHLTGPCVLGTAMSLTVYGKIFKDIPDGDHFPDASGRKPGSAMKEISKVPGRVLVLKQNSDDMGGNRFTDVKRNILMAVADVRPTPTEDEQKEMEEKEEEEKELKSSSGDKEEDEEEETKSELGVEVDEFGGKYEFEPLYAYGYSANEDIVVEVMPLD